MLKSGTFSLMFMLVCGSRTKCLVYFGHILIGIHTHTLTHSLSCSTLLIWKAKGAFRKAEVWVLCAHRVLLGELATQPLPCRPYLELCLVWVVPWVNSCGLCISLAFSLLWKLQMFLKAPLGGFWERVCQSLYTVVVSLQPWKGLPAALLLWDQFVGKGYSNTSRICVLFRLMCWSQQ